MDMAAPAYAFERFAPRPKVEPKKQPPALRVAPGNIRAKKALAQSRLRLFSVIVCAILFVGLTAALLQTQAGIASLQAQISAEEKKLVDQEALNVYLTYELEGKTNIKGIEQRAKELGLVKVEQDQIVYVQDDQENQITVQPSGLSSAFGSMRSGALSIIDYLQP